METRTPQGKFRAPLGRHTLVPPPPTALLFAALDVGTRGRAGISAAAGAGAAARPKRRGTRTPPPHSPRPASLPRGPAPCTRAGPAPPGRPRPRRPYPSTSLPGGGGPGPTQTSRRVHRGVTDGPAPSAIPPRPGGGTRPYSPHWESRRRSARGPKPPPLRRPRVYLQVAAFVLEILEPLVVQFLVVRHGRAGDSFPRPGPAGSAPTTTPHRHSQEPGRRLSCNARRAAASFLLSPASALAFSSSPRPPPPRPNPSATAAPEKTTAGPGGGNGGGMCCRLRGGGSLDLRAPESRPRPSPPAQLADWPARLPCARPIKKDDGERGRKRKRKGEESGAGREGRRTVRLGGARRGQGGEGPRAPGATRRKRKRIGRLEGRRGRGGRGRSWFALVGAAPDLCVPGLQQS